MDRFSELVAKGVAAFNYTPTNNDNPSCPVCREYNNIFSMATDTHMSCLDDGLKVITGHLISNKQKFDLFIWSCQFMGVDFRHSGANCFAKWMYKYGYKGEYSFMNGEAVYILSDATTTMGPEENPENLPKEPTPIMVSYTTESNSIPVSTRFLSKRGDMNDIKECSKEDVFKTAQAMNEHRYIVGEQWGVAYLSDGPHIFGSVNGENYIVL